MKQHKIETRHPILDASGHLVEAGYSTQPMLDYHPNMIKAPKWRIKEWDYYFVGNEQYGVALTLADNRYMGVCGLIFFDFEKKSKYDYTNFFFFPFGKLNMPNRSLENEIKYAHKGTELYFIYHPDHTQLKGKAIDKKGNVLLDVDLRLFEENEDSMVIATPFKKKKAFYYNQKINHLRAEGSLTHLDQFFDLTDNYGVLDWGRGVWTYNNTWYWSSASGVTKDHHTLGFNLGYGFGDTSQASENMVFYDGKGYKTEDIVFDIPENITDPWTFRSNDDSVALIFTPIYDNRTKVNYVILGQDAHQVFGIFEGYVNLEGVGHVKVDHLFGFAERVRNRW
jgi:hypothetical protein